MSTLVDADSDLASTRAWSRMFFACVLSFSLHFFLLTEVPVSRGGGAQLPTTTFSAQLEPAERNTPAISSLEQQPTNDSNPEKSTRTDSPIDPVATADTRKQEPKPVATAREETSGAGIEMPMMRDPTYYAAKQLDVYPRPLEFREPTCTLTAISSHATGKILILALVDEFGVVNDVSVVEGESEGPMQEAFLVAIRAARFSPGQRQGRNVKSRAVIRAGFDCTDKNLS